ncbi:MAG: hypothetical protein MUE73_22285, partial [Planctomycetes bacterium]|nr:hypothetical protein [Planctomycetota bacterium]
MRRMLHTLSLGLLASAVVALTIGCGGGGGGGGGNGGRQGKDTPPTLLNLQTPMGLQGKRGADPVSGLVQLVYQLRDKQFDPVELLEVEYGVDPDPTDATVEWAYMPATEGFGGDGIYNLDASPGGGALHYYVWDSVADIGTGRHVTLDYVYTPDGRVAIDDYGDEIFVTFAGARLRFRPVVDGVPGDWVYTDPFDVNNNNVPEVQLIGIQIPPEGVSNEYVMLDWRGVDKDSDPITIAVDFAVLPPGYAETSKTPEELAAELTWGATTPTPAGFGEGTYNLTATPVGVSHVFGWDSPVDAGTISDRVLLRVRPLDGKNEVGEWVYMPANTFLDNFTIFNNPIVKPEDALGYARIGHTMTLLADGTGGAATENGTAQSSAKVFFPGSTQTTEGRFGPQMAMSTARRGHTATRLQPEEGVAPMILLAGGFDASGNPLNSLEVYDPTNRIFLPVGSTMSEARANHVAVLLRSGKVLLAGGVKDTAGVAASYLSSADVYDPATGLITPVSGSMNDARALAEGVLLPGVEDALDTDGWVLIAGGRDNAGALATIELYDALGNTFIGADVDSDLSQARLGLTLTETTSADFTAVAAGGMASPPVNTIERFDSLLREWALAGATMSTARAWHTAALLGDGKVLFVGGQVNDTGTTLTGLADIYDVANDQLLTPNGNWYDVVRDSGGVRHAEAAALARGRIVLVGGITQTGPTSNVRIFVPRSVDGFNDSPTVQIKTPTNPEPYLFGIRMYWRAFDRENDPVRIVAQFQIRDDPEGLDDSASLDANLKNRWLPATMKERTDLGEYSSGLTGLSSRDDVVTQEDDPIDYPDQYPDDPSYVPQEGEHLFVWNPVADLGLKGDYSNCFFRLTVFGGVEGETLASGRFSIAANAPVIARIADPLEEEGVVCGNIVFPFFLQDADSTDGDPDVDWAKVVFEYGIDGDGDGYITDADKLSSGDASPWYLATHATVDREIDGTWYTDAGDEDLVSSATGNETGGIPYGQ